jgi:hypothetical protein
LPETVTLPGLYINSPGVFISTFSRNSVMPGSYAQINVNQSSPEKATGHIDKKDGYLLKTEKRKALC